MKRKLSHADIQQLHALGSMKDNGILTPEEFKFQKELLLAHNLGEGGRSPQRVRALTRWFAAAVVLLVVVGVAMATLPAGSGAQAGRKSVQVELQ